MSFDLLVFYGQFKLSQKFFGQNLLYIFFSFNAYYLGYSTIGILWGHCEFRLLGSQGLRAISVGKFKFSQKVFGQNLLYTFFLFNAYYLGYSTIVRLWSHCELRVLGSQGPRSQGIKCNSLSRMERVGVADSDKHTSFMHCIIF